MKKNEFKSLLWEKLADKNNFVGIIEGVSGDGAPDFCVNSAHYAEKMTGFLPPTKAVQKWINLESMRMAVLSECVQATMGHFRSTLTRNFYLGGKNE